MAIDMDLTSKFLSLSPLQLPWSATVIEYYTFVYHIDIDWDADNYLVIREIYCFASEEITVFIR